MAETSRRSFLTGATAAATILATGAATAEQAPARGPVDDPGGRRQRLANALRELNEAAGLGIPEGELSAAEAYAVGAILEAEAKLHPIVLPDDRELSTWFAARVTS